MPGGKDDDHVTIVWMLLAILLIVALTWWFGRAYIATAFIGVKRFEIHLLSFFTDRLQPIRTYMLGLNPGSMELGDFRLIAGEVGYYLRWPCISLLLVMAFILSNKKSALQYKKKYTMKSLLEFQLPDWPACAPVVKLDLVKESIFEGPWAVAMQPLQYVKKHKLIKLVKDVGSSEGRLSREQKQKMVLLRAKASKLFMLQVGDLWTGVDKLPPHVKALFAAFAAKIARDGKSAQAFLDKISTSSMNKLDFSGTDALLKKYQNHPDVVAITKKHAYTLTVMATMLETARNDGVLSSALFLWLKPVDRRLWFMLNTVGRWTAVVEVAGPYAHWLAEKELNRAIKTPMIEQATKALDDAIQDIVYT